MFRKKQEELMGGGRPSERRFLVTVNVSTSMFPLWQGIGRCESFDQKIPTVTPSELRPTRLNYIGPIRPQCWIGLSLSIVTSPHLFALTVKGDVLLFGTGVLSLYPYIQFTLPNTMFHTGTILRRTLASPTVMVLELDVPSIPSFLPGQWVDFVVPSHTWMGGFSIASSPRDLPKITLAIKRSSHSPATWVHEESKIGQEVQVRVGGTCVLLPPLSEASEEYSIDSSPSRVFLAGGIGISPILCQYREFLHHRANIQVSSTTTTTGPPTKFLYTVSDETELVFADELRRLAQSGQVLNPNDEMIFSITQKEYWSADADSKFKDVVNLKTGRIMNPFLTNQTQDSVYYICGPPSMIDDAVTFLTDDREVDPSNIHYEKWW